MHLLLAPEKVITSTLKETWIKSGSKNMILFTAGDNQSYCDLMQDWNGKIFKHIEFFKNYATNDLIGLRATELAKQYKISRIIPMAEADILRAANLREKLGVEGQSIENAILFRDKIAMKRYAQRYDIAVPKFKCIKDTVDIINFIEEVGYPIVIKPIMGRGSLNTLVIKNELELCDLLNSGLISDTSRYSDLLAEEFIESEIYHLDGLQLNGKVTVMSVAKYINNCLAFVNGAYLGSYTLSSDNHLKNKLLQFGYHLLESVFPLPKNSLFHIELFVDKHGNIRLCEIACRLGGNGINDEVMLQQGIDIKMEYIRAECGLPFFSEQGTLFSKKAHIAARVLIPPEEGKLLDIPQQCNLNGVLRYESRGKAGNSYRKMQMSNNEIANFLLAGDNELEIQEKINAVISWFYHHAKWETT